MRNKFYKSTKNYKVAKFTTANDSANQPILHCSCEYYRQRHFNFCPICGNRYKK